MMHPMLLLLLLLLSVALCAASWGRLDVAREFASCGHCTRP
jgi:hypothetical protein